MGAGPVCTAILYEPGPEAEAAPPPPPDKPEGWMGTAPALGELAPKRDAREASAGVGSGRPGGPDIARADEVALDVSSESADNAHAAKARSGTQQTSPEIR